MKTDNPLFDKFWDAYPWKKEKAETINRFKSLKVNEVLLSKILSALEQDKKLYRKVHADGFGSDIYWRFMPYPHRWLRKKHWLDDEPISKTIISRPTVKPDMNYPKEIATLEQRKEIARKMKNFGRTPYEPSKQTKKVEQLRKLGL